MELTLTEGCWIKFCTYLAKVICLYNYSVSFITPNDRPLPMLMQFLFFQNGINMFMGLRVNCPTPCFNQFCWNFIYT